MSNSESDTKSKPAPECFCGIEIARADSLCTERDCPYKRE